MRIRETTSEEIGLYSPRADGTRATGHVLLTDFGTCTLVSLHLREKQKPRQKKKKIANQGGKTIEDTVAE